MTTSPYDRIEAALVHGGTAQVLETLADELLQRRKYHELFEARKFQVRHRLGLPLIPEARDTECDETTVRRLEEGLVDACREVGTLLLQSGKIREGYAYMRPVGDDAIVARELEMLEMTDDRIEEMIDILFQERIDPTWGVKLILDHYGMCNAITTFESQGYNLSKTDQESISALLVQRLHQETVQNVKGHIAQQEGGDSEQPDVSPEETLTQLMEGRDWLTADGNYHVDTSHLASVVRFAKHLSDDSMIALAWDLSNYGTHLDQSLQYPGEPPFEDLFQNHRLYLSALLGREVDRATEFFRGRAESSNVREEGTFVVETYIQLLERLGKLDEAIDATVRMIPSGTLASGFAPSLYELCDEKGDFRPLLKSSRERDDLVGFAAGVLQMARS